METNMATVKTFKGEVLHEWPVIKWLTNDARAGWIWLVVRIWLGYQWVSAAQHKLTSPDWMETGKALQGFWLGAVKVDPTTLKGAITFDWYRTFLQFMLDAQAYTWFAKLVAVGELTVGICLIIGAFTGIAAFMGGFMNFNFMLAGSSSTNPLLFVAALGIILAWKVAGYIGADFYILRWIGTPWHVKSAEVPVKATV
jgi:thiosulfate dehydrogenase [quinone] large subunit